MRRVLLPLIVFLCCEYAFGSKNPSDYPLKVTVVQLSSSTVSRLYSYTSGGRGDIEDGQSVRGFEFNYTCDFRVVPLPAGQFYPAKWIKPQKELRILAAQIGESSKYKECDLKTTVRDDVYVFKNRNLTLISQNEFMQWKAEEESAHREIADVSDYRVNLRVIEESFAFTPAFLVSRPAGRFKGAGKGNLLEGASARAVDFTYECIGRIFTGRVYPARWTDPGSQLEVLVQVPGRLNSYYSCKVATAVKPEVYTQADGAVAGTISQEEYAKRLVAAKSASAPNSSATGETSKLLVTSLPDGADIEVDGNFMGNAPSTLSLPAGQHEIVLRKAGYKMWQKKMMLANGDVKLNAELESDRQNR